MTERRRKHKGGMNADEEGSYVRRHGLAIGVGVLASAVLAAGVALFIWTDDGPPPRRAPELTIVNIIPPPPPPPRPEQPKVEQPEPEPEMIDQTKVQDIETKADEDIEKPEDAPPDPSDEPPGASPLDVDTTAQGPGDQFNLAARPGARGFGGGGGGSRFGWYFSIVTQQIESAIRSNPKTRNIVAQVQVRIWADGTGRISRVELVNSTGTPEVDAAIRGEVLAGLTLRQPPPPDLQMPIVARITGRRST